METRPWYRSTVLLLVSLLLVPPLGIVLVWLRRRWRLSVRMLLTVLAVLGMPFYMHLMFGLRLLVLELRPWRGGDARLGWILPGLAASLVIGGVFLAGAF